MVFDKVDYPSLRYLRQQTPNTTSHVFRLVRPLRGDYDLWAN
jgi:hypothetical protein